MQIALKGLPHGTIVEIGDGVVSHTFVIDMEKNGTVYAHRKGVKLYEVPEVLHLNRRFTWLHKWKDREQKEHTDVHDIMRPTQVRIELPHRTVL